MSMESSPYRQPEEIRAILLPICCFLPMFGFQFARSNWGSVGLFAIIALVLYLQMRPMIGNGVMARMKRLHAELPWFQAQVVTVHPAVDRADLPTILARHGFELFELDGRHLQGWHDLAEALTARFGAERFPSDPRQKVLKILGKVSAHRAHDTAIRWNHADATAAAAPGFLADFAASYRFPGMPFFLPLTTDGKPVAAQKDASATVRRYGDDDANDAERVPASLADAPAGAWWKPQPGELTR